MSTMLEYKGYLGSFEYSNEGEVLHGRLEFIRDLVTYELKDAKGIRVAFQEAVDDYLDLCEAEGRKPDVPLKGSFNVRPDATCTAARCFTRGGGGSTSILSSVMRCAAIWKVRIARRDALF